jgi:hypothetical protein
MSRRDIAAFAARSVRLRRDRRRHAELEHHPMQGEGGDTEEALHVSFGWWAPVDLRVSVDEGEVLYR